MCDNRSYPLLLCATIMIIGDNTPLLTLAASAVLSGVRRQKKCEGSPRDHPPVGLEARAPLQPVESAMELGHQGERELHVHPGRGLALRPALRFFDARLVTACTL